MHIKELIKQKKIKTIKLNERKNNKEDIHLDKRVNLNDIESSAKKPTKKINNVPCDHSAYVFGKPDIISHIELKDKKKCLKDCLDHPCTFLCPSHVYGWTLKGIQVDYQRCIECGACNIFCPTGNIQWSYPRSGYGIQRRY